VNPIQARARLDAPTLHISQPARNIATVPAQPQPCSPSRYRTHLAAVSSQAATAVGCHRRPPPFVSRCCRLEERTSTRVRLKEDATCRRGPPSPLGGEDHRRLKPVEGERPRGRGHHQPTAARPLPPVGSPLIDGTQVATPLPLAVE
jgi:hypothetical protein